jgi:uncharacterized protein (TIGR02646 family)
MEKIERPDAPGWLKEKWKKWGKEWEAKCAKTNKKPTFHWRRHKKKGYEDLLEVLSAMTQAHCSFCDSYSLGQDIPETIEHFKPKSLFPLEAYKWGNLFLCCGQCQKKGDKFDERLLKPDEDYYSFDKYFDIETATGKLIPNRNAPFEDQERARITIKLYWLNHNGKYLARKRQLKHFKQMTDPDINEFPYRFFIKRGQGQIE